jgi:hypothetical protein
MKFEEHFKYGDPKAPWKPNLLTALLQLLFLPIAWLLMILIGILIMLLEIATVSSMHITFSAISKPIQMPDRSIRTLS